MSENETPAQDQMAVAEQERQRAQAQGEQDRLAGVQDSAEDQAEQARVQGEIDPASPEGQQAAMRRGDPVQLQGDEMLGGHRLGTNTTHNESMVAPVAPQPGPQGHNFVTGAMGEPIPAGEGVTAERPSVGAMDLTLGEAEGEHPDEPASAPYEQSERDRIAAADESYAGRLNPQDEGQAGLPPKSALKQDWVDHAVAQGADRETAENMTKDELITEHGGEQAEVQRDGTEGPGVSA